MAHEEPRSALAVGFEITLITLGSLAVLAWLGALIYAIFA